MSGGAGFCPLPSFSLEETGQWLRMTYLFPAERLDGARWFVPYKWRWALLRTRDACGAPLVNPVVVETPTLYGFPIVWTFDDAIEFVPGPMPQRWRPLRYFDL